MPKYQNPAAADRKCYLQCVFTDVTVGHTDS